MAAKQFAKRIRPLDEWILVRVPEEEKGKVLLAERTDTGKMAVVKGGPTKQNHGIVVDVGPGAYNDRGVLIPVDPRIKPGATIVYQARVAHRPPDFQKEMEAEGLLFVPAGACVCVLEP